MLCITTLPKALYLSPEKLVELEEMSKSKSNFVVEFLRTLFSKEEPMSRSVVSAPAQWLFVFSKEEPMSRSVE